jgi:hypothetical protein
MTQTTPVSSSDTITAGPIPCAECGETVDSRASSCWNCGLVFGYAGPRADHRLWVPLRTPADHGPRAYAAQMLEMVLGYRLIEDAWLTDGGFVVVDQGEHRELSADQVLDEYGDRVADMVTAVMEHSNLTTTDVPVTVGAASGPVPFVEDVEDRLIEYLTYWPERTA